MTDAEIIQWLRNMQGGFAPDEAIAAANRIEEYARAFANLHREYDKRADRIAALDEIARLGQQYDAETEAGGSIIQGLREAMEYTKGMLVDGDDMIRRGDALECFMGLDRTGDIKDAIAALPAVTVGVKPLVWHPDHGCEARGMGILYAMCETTPGLFAMTNPFHSEVDLPQTEMQAAAQADYEARIRAALEPVTQPAPVQTFGMGILTGGKPLQPAPDAAAIREAALREAAEACRYDDAHDCRDAILALLTEKPHDR